MGVLTASILDKHLQQAFLCILGGKYDLFGLFGWHRAGESRKSTWELDTQKGQLKGLLHGYSGCHLNRYDVDERWVETHL